VLEDVIIVELDGWSGVTVQRHVVTTNLSTYAKRAWTHVGSHAVISPSGLLAATSTHVLGVNGSGVSGIRTSGAPSMFMLPLICVVRIPPHPKVVPFVAIVVDLTGHVDHVVGFTTHYISGGTHFENNVTSLD
jgi:hypothetical protein